MRLIRAASAALLLAACSQEAGSPYFEAARAGAEDAPGGAFTADANRLMADVRWLADDARRGRRTGAPEMDAVRAFLTDRMEDCGVAPFGGGYAAPFTFESQTEGRVKGVNLLGRIGGTGDSPKTIVITAHYDHEGVKNGEIYNGADDNASGVAALLEMACHYQDKPLEHDLVVALLDAEELGLQGARAFMAAPPVPAEAIALNVNMDMVSRSGDGDIFAVGTRQFPVLKPLAEKAAAMTEGVVLKFGFDDPELPRSESWVMASDHAAFYRAGIPFIYFGVEDHADYHRPTDDASKIDPEFFASAVTLIGRAVILFDENLEQIDATRSEPDAF